MTTNIYIDNFTETVEQDLIDELVEEAIQYYGHDVNYIARTLVGEDFLFHEDTISTFTQNYIIEMYIASNDGWAGEGDIITRFGMEVRDEVSLTVNSKRFKEITGMKKPLEGDYIYFPLGKALFEVKFVEDEVPFYQLGKNYVFQITAELIDYSQETLTTGVTNVDDVETKFDNNDDPNNDPFSTNDDIETLSDTIQDFSEENPFGDDP